MTQARTDPLAHDLLSDDTFFLSPRNPMATRDQRELEEQALDILDRPAIAKAIELATGRFQLLAGPDAPDEAKAGLEPKMREWAFWHITTALNSDPDYPKVYGNVLGPPHRWFGMDVPGSRGPCTGENADTTYSFAPLDAHSRFELIGRVQDPPVYDCPIYITANMCMSQNVASLDWRDVQIDDDGTFVITIGPEPADGRPNHLQTALDARYLYLRDTRQHWSETMNAYRIRRLGPPRRPPVPIEEKAALAERLLVEDVPQLWWFRQVVAYVEPNTVTQPANSASAIGGMPTQAVLRGRLSLDPGQAYVLTLHPGSAQTSSLSAYDWWMVSGDFGHRTTSLNNTQSAADADGSSTYVFATADPGVHNWIDTEGRRETTFVNRWQALSRDPGAPMPTASGQVVPLSGLDSALPAGTATVTPEQRRQQLAERTALFRMRFAV
jgi:hypothetical protein